MYFSYLGIIFYFCILFFFLKMRTFKAYSQQLSNIQYSIINCSHHGCLYMVFIHVYTGVSPECFLHLCQPPVCSLNLWLLVFILASKYKWDRTVFVFDLFHLAWCMMPSRCVHVVTNSRICFFLWLKNIPLYMCVFLLMLLLVLKFCNLKSIFIFYLDSVSHSFKCDINFFFLLYPTSFLHLVLLVIC